MKKFAALALGIVLVFSLVRSTAAQFADQATYAGAGTGTNAQAITLANATSYAGLTGVLIKYIPGGANTTAATLAVSGNAGALGGGPISFRKPSAAGLIALTGGELISGQPVWIMYDGTFFDILSVTSTTVTAANLANSSLSYNAPVNLQLNASVGSNQLTISVTGNNGANASATNPVPIAFRDVTIANGDPVIISLQAALSFTISSGNTMGCVSGQMCRLWIDAINNAGTISLCAYNALSGTSIFGLTDNQLTNSGSGTGGGSTAQTNFCNVGSIASKAIRLLGYVEIQEVTAGTWATGPTIVQLFGPGIKKPGDVIQTVNPVPITATTTLASTQTQTAITASIAPTSAANVIEASAAVSLQNGAGDSSILQFSRGTSPTLFGSVGLTGIAVQTSFYAVPVFGIDKPNTTSSTTYYIYGECVTSNTCVVNNPNGGFNPSTTITLKEIMSLLEPANDDQPLRMVG